MQGVVVVLWAVLAAAGVDGNEIYVWPLQLPRVLTSSFGEYRDRGFHMGIDLRTGGVGREVYAAADGYVSRVRTSPDGYGKAVYLSLNDGHTAVYAHLSDFAPKLRAYVRARQHALKRYEMDLYFEPEMFPVKAGELVAKSGQTGIGAPHLHFELRDTQGRPVSPGSLGMSWPDKVPPTVRSLLVMPATPATTINGDTLPLVLDVRREKEGYFVCKGFEFDGVVALAVDAIDRDSAPRTRLGVAKVQTYAGDQEIFRLRHQRISYSNYRDGAVAYHPFFTDVGRFLVQWRWPGNDVEAYAETSGNGLLYSGLGEQKIKMTISDFQENTSTLDIPMTSRQAPDLPTPVSQTARAGNVSYDTFGNWLTLTVRFDGKEQRAPMLVEGPALRSAPFRRVDDRTFRVNYTAPRGARRVMLDVHHPRVESEPSPVFVAWRGAARRTEIVDNLAITIFPDSPYGVFFLRAERTKVKGTKELRPQGEAYTLWHPSTPVDEPVKLDFALGELSDDARRLAVYRMNGKSRWEHLGGTLRDGNLSVSISKFGTFAVMADESAPKISAVRPAGSSPLTSLRPPIRATVRDAGSGIVDYALTANGKWLLAEYDPERQVVFWVQDEDLPRGLVSLEFVLTDASGNVGRRAFEVEVPSDLN